ncbi:MAG: hypothetical protein ACM3SO_02350 [Betaproteobacteria bacterium]
MVDLGRRYCDLVMKGGITSGVVFPKAIAKLATQYQFCNIGGTSAGAIAAAGAAAAEYRRATSTSAQEEMQGFRELSALPEFLSEMPAGERSRLFHLFAPEARTRRHFAVLAAMLNHGTKSGLASGVAAMVLNFWLAALAGAVPGGLLLLALDRSSGLWLLATAFAGVLLLFGAVLGASLHAGYSLVKALPEQAYGLSRGYSATTFAPGAAVPLVNFLHDFIQRVAGKGSGEPLTFGDLAGVASMKDRPAGIDLRLMTTALTLGRPYSIPFRVREFYFRRDELLKYFPAAVIEWMENHPGERSKSKQGRDATLKELGYLPLPAQDTLPVIVATRMSLSFPGLLSAVPLYRYAWEDRRSSQKASASRAESHVDGAQEAEGDHLPDDPASGRFAEEHMQRVLFSDGGICSNFPVHLFDSILPAWPTFGINLRDDLKEGDRRANLPPRGASLPPERYTIGSRGSFGDVVEFIGAIVRTMQNWRDNLQRAAPGFRDRIVTVSHTPGEGGLNLDMSAEAITDLANSGELAADELIKAFAIPAASRDDYWTYHRWVRLRSLLCVLQGGLKEVHEGVTSTGNLPAYPTLIEHSPDYVGRSYPLRVHERTAAAEALDAMSELHDLVNGTGSEFCRHSPKPGVELRIQPAL